MPGHPEIFVVGDICALEQDGQPLPGVAQVAMQQGAHAAKNVLRAIARRAARAVPLQELRDMPPRSAAARPSATLPALKLSGFFAWIFWIFLHIFWLIGFRNRFVVMTEWAWAYLTFQRRVRLITGEKLWPDSESSR